MKFLLDESVDVRVADFLTALGYQATTVAEDYQASLPDPEVLSIARREQRILVTNDRDFGELVFRYYQRHSGVIYLRLGTVELPAILSRLDDVLERYADGLDDFIVVTPRRIRVRASMS